jgi:hypothetical protein
MDKSTAKKTDKHLNSRGFYRKMELSLCIFSHPVNPSLSFTPGFNFRI